MKKKILSLVLTVCMVLSLLPAVSLPAAATAMIDYTVGETKIGNNADGPIASASGDGWTWAYASGAGTLTLTDAYIRGADSSSDSYGANLPDGTTIVLKGDSTIASGTGSYDCVAVFCRGALRIENGDAAGVGSLSAVGGESSGGDSKGLEMRGSQSTLTIESGRVTGLGGTAYNSSYGIYAQTLIVSGSADVTGIAGTANGSGSNIKSCGVYCNSSASVEGGSLTAVGAYAKGGLSYGIETHSSSLNVSGGTVVAQGGKSTNYDSYGVCVDDGTVALTGGLLVASSGGCGTASGDVSQALNKVPTGGTLLTGAQTEKFAVYGDSTTYTSDNIRTSTLDLGNEGIVKNSWSNSETSSGWMWNAATSTLTLKNMVIVGTNETASNKGSFGILGGGNISIVYEGVNVVCGGTSESGDSCGIEVEETGTEGFSLSGDGTLIALGRQVSGSSCGIRFLTESGTGGFNVSGGKVIALGGDAGESYAPFSCGLEANNLTITGGDVTAVGGAAAGTGSLSAGAAAGAGISVSSGQLVAVGGHASGTGSVSVGACSYGTTIFSGDANIVAAGDGYGIGTYLASKTAVDFQLGTCAADTVTVTAMGGTGAANGKATTTVSGKAVACDGGTYETAGTAVRFRLADAVIAVAHNGSDFTKYASFAEGWNEAVGTNNKSTTTVKLLVDWTATTDPTYGTSFGSGVGFGDGTASGAGFILVPSNKTITLDLNGHTIDRGLTAAQTDGEVICIDSANISAEYTVFTLADSAAESPNGAGNGVTGRITGGNNSGNGGGIYMAGNSVKCTIKGGCISGNRTAGNGGGIVTHGTTNGDFLITGGKITGNSAANGGGIYCAMCCDGISNCIIQGNTATTCGGGIYSDYPVICLGGATVVSGNAHGANAVASTTGNATIGEGGAADNLYLTSGTTVNCLVGTSILATTGASIGVTTQTAPAYGHPVNVAFIENSSVDYSGYYHSDNSSYYIKNTESGRDRTIELCADAAYTVTFNANGHGTAPAALTGVTSGSTISAPTAPTESGYTFGGWYKEAGCTTAWDFASDTVTANTTLYAKWTASTYTVTFNANGHGTAPAALTGVTNGSTISAPTAPTESGYTFGGWYKEDTCANQWNFASDTVTAATTLYAKWTANGGGTPSGSNTFVPPEAEPHGYLLRIQIDTGIDNVPTEITAADPTLSTPAAVESRLKVGIDRVLGTTGSVTVKDFDLSLWVSQDAGATWTRATAENFPAGGITVVIPWQELGLTYEQAQHTSFSVTHMFAASVNGHTPGTTESPAWTITESGLQFTLNGLSPVAVGYKSLPLVTFDANGGSCGTAGAYTAQSGKLASLPVPTRSGYTFAGWYTLEKGGYEITANAVITANTTVYAHWTANSAAAVPAPNTGDNSGTVLWIILMLTGMYGLAAIVVWCRRKGS